MPVVKQDSNFSGLSFAEESSIKTLPVTPNWYAMEPNSFSDFGTSIKTVARSPINPSRQLYRGTIVDVDASGGLNHDFTMNNMWRLLQGLFFADIREKPDTAPYNGTAITITSITSNTINAASGLAVFIANSLLLLQGAATNSNNTLLKVNSATGTTVTVSNTLTAEASPPAATNIEQVGYQFTADDLSLTSSGGNTYLGCTTGDFTTLGFIPGEWAFLGGDAVGLRFVNNVGYFRIKAIAAKRLDIDLTTWTPVTETTTGSKTVQLFFGKVLKNESATNLIKRRTYNLERPVGTDDNGNQFEYLTGSVFNTFTLNEKLTDKLDCDLTFITCDKENRTGLQGIKSGNRFAALKESGINTTSHIYKESLYLVDPTIQAPLGLFAKISDGKITVDNQVKPLKAQGTLGAFEMSAGDFKVSGNVTAYFTTVDAVSAVRNNADAGRYKIFATKNAGFLFDIPLLGLGDARLNVTKGEPITLPLSMDAAANAANYTLMAITFTYLPTIAMPT